jgi:hypothetical protein
VAAPELLQSADAGDATVTPTGTSAAASPTVRYRGLIRTAAPSSKVVLACVKPRPHGGTYKRSVSRHTGAHRKFDDKGPRISSGVLAYQDGSKRQQKKEVVAQLADSKMA